MPTPVVRSILDTAFLIAVGVWMGSTLFVLGGVLPLTGQNACGPLLRRWYAWGVTCGAVALPAAVGAPLSYPEYRGWWAGVQALLIVAATLAMLDGANRPAPSDRQARRATVIGVGVLMVHLVLLMGFAFRPPPRTVGIIEPTPQERAQRAAQAAAESAPESSRPGAAVAR